MTNRGCPLILAVVGTDIHPFDRLIEWVDRWAAEQPHVEVVQQFGYSKPPRASRGFPFIPYAELTELMSRATIVVSHGGPATIADIRQAGRLPIVVPRHAALGEHIDDHQQRYAEHVEALGRVRVVQDRNVLHEHLDLGVLHPARFRCEPGSRPAESAVRRFGEIVGTLAPRRSC